MLYVLYTISASGTRDILYSSNNVDDVRIFYENNADCFTTCPMYRFGVYVGCTEKPLFVLEDNLRYERIPFDEKPYFHALKGFYSLEKSDDFDDDDFNDYELFD